MYIFRAPPLHHTPAPVLPLNCRSDLLAARLDLLAMSARLTMPAASTPPSLDHVSLLLLQIEGGDWSRGRSPSTWFLLPTGCSSALCTVGCATRRLQDWPSFDKPLLHVCWWALLPAPLLLDPPLSPLHVSQLALILMFYLTRQILVWSKHGSSQFCGLSCVG